MEGQSITVMNSSGFKNQQASPHVQQEHGDLLTCTAAEPHHCGIKERLDRYSMEQSREHRKSHANIPNSLAKALREFNEQTIVF